MKSTVKSDILNGYNRIKEIFKEVTDLECYVKYNKEGI